MLHVLNLLGSIVIHLASGAHPGCGQLLPRSTITIGPHTISSIRDSTIGSSGLTGIRNLAIVLVAQTADLIDLHPTLHQLRDNLGLARTRLGLTGNKLNHLLIGHSLCKCHCG